MPSDYDPPLKITSEDLRRASVWRPAASPIWATSEPEAGRNGLAVAALVIAVIGIPLFGLFTGLVAVILGIAALVRAGQTRQRGSEFAIAGIALGVADVAGWAVAIAFLMPTTETGGVDLSEFEPEPAALDNLPPHIQQAMKANVLVQGRTGWRGMGGDTVGSGVILRIDGGQAFVLTNRHVVDPKFSENDAGAASERPAESSVTVKLVGQAALPATVLWMAPDGIDLAVVSVRATSAEAIAANWGSDKSLKIGDDVFAIGNPHGLAWTHTAGQVSQFRQQSIRGRAVRVIQTNTAINPGNSGGGLYDSAGRLVGITTWTRDKRVAEGLSFAIAFDTLVQLDPECLKIAAEKPTP
jgi:S1-C subfamily serine protease